MLLNWYAVSCPWKYPAFVPWRKLTAVTFVKPENVTVCKPNGKLLTVTIWVMKDWSGYTPVTRKVNGPLPPLRRGAKSIESRVKGWLPLYVIKVSEPA